MMLPHSRIAALLAAVAILALTAFDAAPALHGAALILLVLAAAIQIDRELGHALARRSLYPSPPAMNTLTAIVVLHVAYFRVPDGSTFLELINTIVVAMYTLVLVSAVMVDGYGFGARIKHFVLGLLIPLLVGGGLSCALLLQVLFDPTPTARGSWLVALVLGASWCGLAIAALLADDPERTLYQQRKLAGKLTRLLLPAVVVAVGFPALQLTSDGAVAAGIGLGLMVGAGTLIGFELVRAIARRCDVESFRYLLPHQIQALQPLYDKLFRGGLTDYAGALVPVFPLAYAFLHWITR